MAPCLNTEQGGERRPPCLGLLIACGDKNAWSNTFESMCENYYNDVNVGMREELLRHRCGIFTERIISVGNSVHQPVMLRRLENPELPRQFKLVPVVMREGASVKTLDLFA